MFDMIKKMITTGVVTTPHVFTDAPERFRGAIVVHPEQCHGCGDCARICPSQALRIETDKCSTQLKIDHGLCIFCGLCTEHCPAGALQQTNHDRLATKDKDALVEVYSIRTEQATDRGETSHA